MLLGCQESNAERSRATAATPAASAAVPFELTIQPRGDDPRLVDVWLTAPDAQQLARLPHDANGRVTNPPITFLPVTSDVSVEPERPDTRTRPQPLPQTGMLGRCELVEGRLRFRPAFPLIAGETYRAVLNPAFLPAADTDTSLEALYHVPAETAKALPSVLGIYPSGSELPANHLKFYIEFSTPMRPGTVWNHFRLIDRESGEPVGEPFRHTELWSADHRRLTLWFHPGRQKTGVNLNVEIGPILEAGRSYTLLISADWKAENGEPLGEVVRKDFVAVDPDYHQPHPENWQLETPKAGSQTSIRVSFPEPLDWALLQSEMHVESMDGTRLVGRIAVGPDERSWSFLPNEHWTAGDYRLAIGSVLEDLAGNSIERPFEVDLTKAPPRKKDAAPRTVYRLFRIESP